MVSFKTLAAALLLSAAAAMPAFAQAAVQEPGLFSFYYPNLDVLNGANSCCQVVSRLARVEGRVCGDRRRCLLLRRPLRLS